MSKGFVCVECSRKFPSLNHLCGDDYEMTIGMNNEDIAEFDLTCTECGDDIMYAEADFGRTESELFENSGVTIDPGRKQFLENNY